MSQEKKEDIKEKATAFLSAPHPQPLRRFSNPDAPPPLGSMDNRVVKLPKANSAITKNTEQVDFKPLTPHHAGTTVIGEDDEDIPVASWAQISNSKIILPVSDDKDSDEESQEDLPVQNLKVVEQQVIVRGPRRQPRSANRDDSDSEDEDGEKIIKSPKPQDDTIDLLYNPFSTPESLENGFRTGFSEDRNKRYRRSMEDAHRIEYKFGQVPGSGFFAVFDGHAGRAAADYCGNHVHTVKDLT